MGGYEPLWSFKGDRIFYRKDGDFFVVNIELSSDIIFSKPQKLFSGSFLYIQAWGRYYDLFPDEKHFVAVTDSRGYSGTSSINVITNFFKEVKQIASEQ